MYVYWLFIYIIFILLNSGYTSYSFALARLRVIRNSGFEFFMNLLAMVVGLWSHVIYGNGVPSIRDATLCWLNDLFFLCLIRG